MVTMTSGDVERVAGEVEAARAVLAEAEKAYAATPSPGAWTAIGEARGVLERAETRERVTRGQWEALEGHRRARTAAGEAAVAELGVEAARLVETRQAAVEAVVKAEAAMRRALVALNGHDQAVRAVGAELQVRGLREEPGQVTAATLDGSPMLDGVRWPLVDGVGVLLAVLRDEVLGLYPRHPLSRVSAPAYGGLSAAQGRDEVVAEVRGRRRG
ncbi:hypothetical protein [Streptomyces shenzhenensis]|uniref:hypothetical protein n=1 Tax=Streptomyces shenzhenensis TaxID=943815 RepID=UPI001F2D9EBE|nr:hypothetical protein [Streptomyces shenzhenensis]